MHALLKMDLGLVDFDHIPSIPTHTRVRYIGTIAEIATIVAAAGSLASTGYAAAQGTPSVPSPYSSSRQVAQATAAALPYQRGLAAAEAQGGSALRFGYTQSTVTDQQRQQIGQQITALQNRIQALQNPPPSDVHARQSGPNNPAVDNSGAIANLQGQLATLQSKYNNVPAGGGTVYLNSHGQVVPQSEAMANFAGYGTADIQGELARQMEQVQQQVEDKYGVPFAQEARREAEMADPSGFAAREKEYGMIQDELKNPMPINPLSGTIDQQMLERLKAGSGLDQMSSDLLDSAVARANADRGGSTAAGDVATEMSTGMEGAARRQAAEGAAQNWLSSGSTPADIEYRREQQALSDLGSFEAGKTPESQFRNLSGASYGAAPFSPGNAGPMANSSAANAAPGFGVSAWEQSLRNQQAQANPWMSGLSSILSGIGALGQSGGGGGGGTFNTFGGALNPQTGRYAWGP